MSRFCRIILTPMLLATCLSGQGGGSGANVVPLSEIDYFRNLFMTLANLDDKPFDLQRREVELVTKFRLNVPEAKSLHGVIADFHAVLIQIRAVSTPILARAARSPSDKATLDSLVAERDKAVLSLATRLMNELRPDAALRIRQVLKP